VEIHKAEDCKLRGRYVLKEIRAAMEAAIELEVCILFSLLFLLQVDVNYVIVNVQAEGVDEESEEEEEEEVPVEPSSARKDKGKAKALPGPEDWVPEEGTYDEEDEDEDEDDDEDEDEDEDEEELLDEDEFAKWQALVPFEPVTTLTEFVEVEGEDPQVRAARLEAFEESTAEDIGPQPDLVEDEDTENYRGAAFDELGFVSEEEEGQFAPDVLQQVASYALR